MTNAMDAFLSVRLQSRSSGKSLKEHILNPIFSVQEINKTRILNPQIKIPAFILKQFAQQTRSTDNCTI